MTDFDQSVYLDELRLALPEQADYSIDQTGEVRFYKKIGPKQGLFDQAPFAGLITGLTGAYESSNLLEVIRGIDVRGANKKNEKIDGTYWKYFQGLSNEKCIRAFVSSMLIFYAHDGYRSINNFCIPHHLIRTEGSRKSGVIELIPEEFHQLTNSLFKELHNNSRSYLWGSYLRGYSFTRVIQIRTQKQNHNFAGHPIREEGLNEFLYPLTPTYVYWLIDKYLRACLDKRVGMNSRYAGLDEILIDLDYPGVKISEARKSWYRALRELGFIY